MQPINNIQTQATGQNNVRYKTMMCKHYNTTQGCSYGEKCQFAHGPQDLRPFNGQMLNQDQMKTNQKNPLNYKIVKCKNWEKDGTCKYGSHCTFAHGDNDLRNKADNLYSMQPQMGMGMYNPMNMMMENPYMMMQQNFDFNQMHQMALGGQIDPSMMNMNMGQGMDMNMMAMGQQVGMNQQPQSGNNQTNAAPNGENYGGQ